MNRPSRLVWCILLCLLVPICADAQVNYRVTGIVQVIKHSSGNHAILRSGDGRLFNLTGRDIDQFKPFDGKNVTVEGAARQADRVTDLKVTRIVETPLNRDEVVLPPFKPHQRPPRMISHRAPIYQVADVRWGYMPCKERTNDNFRHLKTTFDTSKVDRAWLVLKPFPPEWIAAHSLLFFSFKQGGMVNEQNEEEVGVFLSIEAYQRTDQSYSLTEGLKNTFGVSWILAGWNDYTTQSCEVQKEKLFFYPLQLTQSQLSALLAETLLEATVNRSGEYYHTITNNCTNNLIVLLNRVLPEAKRINLWWIPTMVYNLRATMPIAVPKYLMKKGLVGEPLPEVNASNCRRMFTPRARPAAPGAPVRSAGQ